MNTKDLLTYCWKYRLFESYITTNSKEVEVTDQGLYSHNQGPTFFNAKVRIGHTLWVGNVQVLTKASDWYLNSFDRNQKYDNVILIVCETIDSEVKNSKGEFVPMIQGIVPEKVVRNISSLTEPLTGQALCKNHINEYSPRLSKYAWLAAMQTEFTENWSEYIKNLHSTLNDWDATAFIMLSRSFGFGCNDAYMESLAKSLPLSVLQHHRDDLFQIEAIVFGQAGLLDIEAIPERFHHDALNEGYFAKLRYEYLYLAHKYSMKPFDRGPWKPYGLGPMKYPHVFLSMFANLYYMKNLSSYCMLDLKSAEDAYHVFQTYATPYWQTHYHFGAETSKSEKNLSQNRISYVIATFLVPFLFAYGRAKSSEEICDRAFEIMEQTKLFSTKESQGFEKVGVAPDDAGQVVAMIQLQREYCDKHDCIRCRFGFNFIKQH